MDNIFSITILDFNDKIFFLQKRPEYSFEIVSNLSRNISKSIKANYLQEYIKKQYEFRLMDTIMTSKIKVKVSLLWEVCVIILYSSMIDLHLINLYNQRMIEALYMLCKTKKIKMDYLIKRYHEVNGVLEDTIYYLSPKFRIGSKTEITFGGTDKQEKYNRAAQTLKTLVYNHSTKDFLRAKGEISYHRSQNEKLNRTTFAVNTFMSEAFAFSKNNLLSQFVTDNDYNNKDNSYSKEHNKSNDNIISRKLEKSTVSSVESNKLSSLSISPDVIPQPIISVPYKSNNAVFINHKAKSNKNNKEEDNKEAIQSLKSLDINNVLSSINFNFDTNTTTNTNNTKGIHNLISQTNQQTNNSNNNVLFANDFFNLIQPQKVQFTDFKMATNEEFVNNSNEINRSQSLPKKPPSQGNNHNNEDNIIKKSDVPYQKHQSPEVIQNQQQHFINNTNRNAPVIELNLASRNNNKNLFTNDFNFNHISNTKPQIQNLSIDCYNLNSIGLQEDIFDLKEIRKQIRCSIIEKGTLINTKGTYTDINYRGQIALELTSNFIIHNKAFNLKVNHPNWLDPNCFNKSIFKSIVSSEEGQDNYKLHCKDIKSMERIIDYTPNLKIIQPGAEFQVTGAFKGEKYKLELICQMNENAQKHMRASQMIITIITKSNDIVINKTNNSNYKIEDKKMTYMIRDFHSEPKLFLGIIFKTNDPTFVQIVKVNYRYMDILPSSLNVELSYIDEQGVMRLLDVAKKCIIELSFTP